MSPRSKKEYLEAIFPRYKKAKSKEQRTKIINELCETCKYHRKHAIRLLTKFKRFTKPKPRKRGKPSMYNQPPILAALERIWKDAGMPFKAFGDNHPIMAAAFSRRAQSSCH